MTKYHISTSGEPVLCEARINPCPRGHFATKQEALDSELFKKQLSSHLETSIPASRSAGFSDEELRRRLTGMTTVDAAEVKDLLEELNEGGDRVFLPGSLRLNNSRKSVIGSFTGIEDGRRYEVQITAGKFLMVYDSYENDDEDEDVFLTEARAKVGREMEELDYSETITRPGKTGWETDVVADNLFQLMEEAQDGRDWNHDTGAAEFMYFGEAFSDINMNLRNGSRLSKNLIATLDRSMEKDMLTKPVIVYRGVRVSNESTRQMLTSGNYSDPAYLSTSTDEQTARNFAGNGRHPGFVMKLTLPAGTKCRDQREDSEHEITLPRNFDLSSAEWIPVGE
jgi:hypothetical protein